MQEKSFTVSREEHGTILCALIHYSLACADPISCISALEKVSPDPKQPWYDIIGEARTKQALLRNNES